VFDDLLSQQAQRVPAVGITLECFVGCVFPFLDKLVHDCLLLVGWASDITDGATDDGACDGSGDAASGTNACPRDRTFDRPLGASLDREINAAVSHWLDADCGVLLAQNLVNKHALSFEEWI